jgi:DNA repair protein RadC
MGLHFKDNQKGFNQVQENYKDYLQQRFIENGLEYFDTCEILELLLTSSKSSGDVKQVAHKLINEFGSLVNLFDASPICIAQNCCVELNVAIILSMIPDLARFYLKNKYTCEVQILNSTKKIGNYAITLLAGRSIEYFYVICLDAQKKLLKTALLSSGTIDETVVYPRDVVEISLKHKATNIILVHNHPGSSFLPSSEDLFVTKKIKNLLQQLDINVLDHIIVAGNQYYSFVERHRF